MIKQSRVEPGNSRHWIGTIPLSDYMSQTKTRKMILLKFYYNKYVNNINKIM